jgi:transcriptional regulator with XRE-family HTH domain
MNVLGARLRELRLKNGLTQKEVSKRLNISESAVGMYERGEREPSHELTRQFADFYRVSADYLIGRTDEPSSPILSYHSGKPSAPDETAAGPKEGKTKPDALPPLTRKDERDIGRDLERILNNLESNEALAFHGEPLDEESKELLRISLEHSMRLAKQIAKQKFTPNKYRRAGKPKGE